MNRIILLIKGNNQVKIITEQVEKFRNAIEYWFENRSFKIKKRDITIP